MRRMSLSKTTHKSYALEVRILGILTAFAVQVPVKLV